MLDINYDLYVKNNSIYDNKDPSFVICRKKLDVGGYSPSCHMSPSYLINHHWPSSINGPESNTITIYPADTGGLEGCKEPFSVSASSCTSDDPRLIVESQAETPSSAHSQSSVSTPEPPELDQGESLDTPPSPPKNGSNDLEWVKRPQYEDISSNECTPQRKNQRIENCGEVEKDKILNTPLKALSDAAKKLFVDDVDGTQKMNLVFISPSKRKPRRIPLIKVARNVDSPDKKDLFLSSWEEQFNVKDLDKHRTTKDGDEASDENYQDTSSQCSSTVYSNYCTSPSTFVSDGETDLECSNQSFIENEKTITSESFHENTSSYLAGTATNSKNEKSKANDKQNRVINDNHIFKTPIKTPSKAVHKRYRTPSSSSSGSPSPKRTLLSLKSSNTHRRLESSPSSNHRNVTYQSLFGTPEKSESDDENGSLFPSPKTYFETAENGSKKNVKDQQYHSNLSTVSRRSPRLKDGVVKSLFNKNSVDVGQKTNPVQKLTFKQKDIEGYQAANLNSKQSSSTNAIEHSSPKEDVLLDLDVNRPLVTQLTPKKKVPQFEKNQDAFNCEANESKVYENSDTALLGSNKMSESLSNALGLFPKSILPKKSTSSFVNTDVDKTNLALKDTPSMSKKDNFKTKALKNLTLSNGGKGLFSSNDSNSTTFEDNVSSDQRIRSVGDSLNKLLEENQSDKENTSSNDNSQTDSTGTVAHGGNKNNLDPVAIDGKGKQSSIIDNKDKTPNEENVSKSLKKKVRKKARELQILVKENMKGNTESNEKIQWPSSEDVKRAYAELNLIPPSSPNKIFK